MMGVSSLCSGSIGHRLIHVVQNLELQVGHSHSSTSWVWQVQQMIWHPWLQAVGYSGFGENKGDSTSVSESEVL